MSSYIIPVRIVTAENTENTELLFEEKILQPPFRFYTEESEEKSKDDCRIKKGGYVLLDFGKEISGGIVLAVQRVINQASNIRIVFGESVMEALSDLGEKNSGNYHSIRDFTVPAVSLSQQRFGQTGFRFVKIESPDSDILIRAVVAEADDCTAEQKGKFECNDELLNEIWKTAAYTVQLNIKDVLLEGLKRDRLVWIGDMHPEVSTVRTVFGEDSCVPKSLDFVRDNTPAGEWMNSTATYSMWWIIIHYDWYMHWGRLDYLKEQTECLKSTCDRAFNWIDRDFESEPNMMEGFVDWSSKYTDSEMEGRRAITCIAMDRAAKIFAILGDKEYEENCRRYTERLQGECVDAVNNKRMSALTVLAGRDSRTAKEVLAGSSAEEMSCFMGYYVLIAKCLLGNADEAVDIIREYWGGMLKMGATSFWEDFDIKWMENSAGIDVITPDGMKDIHGDFGKHCYKGFRHSLCHGWASGPAPFLMEQIGGIEILEAGCKKIRISPKLGDLEWVKIEYPTPYGILKVSAEKDDGKVRFTVDAPTGIEIVN